METIMKTKIDKSSKTIGEILDQVDDLLDILPDLDYIVGGFFGEKVSDEIHFDIKKVVGELVKFREITLKPLYVTYIDLGNNEDDDEFDDDSNEIDE